MIKQTLESNLNISTTETKIDCLGECKFKNPNKKNSDFNLTQKRIIINPFLDGEAESLKNLSSFKIASPSTKIFFDYGTVRAGIVTCGGICPGLNNVIRSIVLSLTHYYGCHKIFGFKFGLQGFIKKYNHPIVELTPEVVSRIHDFGGTLLGTSRGKQQACEIVDTLHRLKINQLYFIGGDGSLRAAEGIAEEIKKRKLDIGLTAIPKTIDNDIPFASESFGFDTAVEISTKAIKSAHIEALASPYGIGLVKLMGRHSGFIATSASLSQRDVNYVLIPEYDFDLDGDKGFLNDLRQRMINKKHAVVVIAEGAGQKLLKNIDKNSTDASGNPVFGDIGVFMRDQISRYFTNHQMNVNIKYIDPSYMIRSVASNTHDDLFTATLGQNAVHALMAGKTNLMISIWHGVYCYVPLKLVNQREKRLSLSGRMWLNVLESTGQPSLRND
ncbi:MAG: ATP-dependent 6-phosphofructokinase [SAR324 cluster bacterium]|nr:ATP-dependent 6-phosphofructokinase [SAR324 cluster bacterium]